MKKTFITIIIVFMLIALLLVWYGPRYSSLYIHYDLDDVPPPPALPVQQPATTTKPATTTTVVGQPTFTWSFRKTPGGDIAMTEITLTATYPNGTKRSQIIETVDGSCNDVDASDKDAYAKSNMVVCYYSGFGINYKIVKDANGYVVMRKEFEEAGPDYNPPVQMYKEFKRF